MVLAGCHGRYAAVLGILSKLDDWSVIAVRGGFPSRGTTTENIRVLFTRRCDTVTPSSLDRKRL